MTRSGCALAFAAMAAALAAGWPAVAQDRAGADGALQETEPEWLSDTVTRPHANVATAITRPEIEILPLDAVALDAVGLLPRSITGLPNGLWGASDAETLARLFRSQRPDGLPAILAFTRMLALAELTPPPDTPRGALLLARLDMLLERGALEPALALMERAGPTDPEVFRRFFDVSLLTGHGGRACTAMAANPDIAPTFPARVFCLARSGDWSAAALSLGTGEALGRISPGEADLIARFLDPELFHDAPPLSRDLELTPLSFEMRVAIADRPDLTGAPLAFVHADLSPLAGWRAQLNAAERLTRSGAIEAQEWFAIYTARVPSASGGIWDRVAAVQALDTALLAGDAQEVARRLGPAFELMNEAGLAVAFSTIFAERLQRLALSGEAGAIARRVALLSPMAERVALSSVPQDETEAFAFAIARGAPPAATAARSGLDAAVAAAFAAEPPPHPYVWLIENDRMGEAFLLAARILGDREADFADITGALALFRSVGLETMARQAALQLILSDG